MTSRNAEEERKSWFQSCYVSWPTCFHLLLSGCWRCWQSSLDLKWPLPRGFWCCLCACIWNNSWSAQREVIKKPDPVNADLGNKNQGISLNKKQPKQAFMSFSDWSTFLKITHRFCKTSASLFPSWYCFNNLKVMINSMEIYKVWNILSSHILHHVAIIG